jgi:hypothetical protein
LVSHSCISHAGRGLLARTLALGVNSAESGRHIVELNGRCGAFTPALSACRHPLHSRLCGSLLRHGSNRPQLNCLALGRPQIPAQLSAPVRPGGSLTEAKCWAVRFPCGGGAVQHLSRQIRPTESFARLRSLPDQQLETCCIRKRRSNNMYSSEAVDISVFRRLDSSSDVLSPPPP